MLPIAMEVAWNAGHPFAALALAALQVAVALACATLARPRGSTAPARG